jgi:hypothetical protein
MHTALAPDLDVLRLWIIPHANPGDDHAVGASWLRMSSGRPRSPIVRFRPFTSRRRSRRRAAACATIEIHGEERLDGCGAERLARAHAAARSAQVST